MNGKVIVSRNVVFDEKASWNWNNRREVAETNIFVDLEAPSEAHNGVPAIMFDSP